MCRHRETIRTEAGNTQNRKGKWVTGTAVPLSCLLSVAEKGGSGRNRWHLPHSTANRMFLSPTFASYRALSLSVVVQDLRTPALCWLGKLKPVPVLMRPVPMLFLQSRGKTFYLSISINLFCFLLRHFTCVSELFHYYLIKNRLEIFTESIP